MFQRVQKIVKPRADRSMMQTSTVARKLSAACIFAGWWDRRKPWHYWPRIRGSWPRANLSTLLRGPLRTYGSRISWRFRAFSWWEELRYAYDGLRVEAWAFRWSTWKRKKKRKPPCALGTRFLANAGTLFQGWEKEREREGLSTPLDEVKINSCSQRRNSIYRERRSRVVFLLSSFFIFFDKSIRPFSILGLFSLLVFDASFVVEMEREIPVFSATMPPLFNFFRYKIFTVATRNDVTVVIVNIVRHK